MNRIFCWPIGIPARIDPTLKPGEWYVETPSNVVQFDPVDRLRKKSGAHAALMEMWCKSPVFTMSMMLPPVRFADTVLEELWAAGYKVVPRGPISGNDVA